MSRLVTSATATLASAPFTSRVHLVPCACLAKSASCSRTFVSSSIKAADPSTASTSATPAPSPSDFSRRLKLRTRAAKSSKSLPARSTAKAEGLTELLKAARLGPTSLDTTRSKIKPDLTDHVPVKEATAPVSTSEPGSRGSLSKRVLQKLRRRAAAAAAAAASKSGASKGKGKAISTPAPNASQGIGGETPLGVDRLQPTSESSFEIASAGIAQPTKNFLGRDVGDEDAIAMMEKMVEDVITKCLAESGSEANKEEQRLRKFLSTTLAKYREVKAKKKKEKLKSDFLRKLEASQSALEAGDQTQEASESQSAEEAFDAALAEAEDISDEGLSVRDTLGHELPVSVRDIPPHELQQHAALANLELRHTNEVSAADISIGALQPLEDIPVASLAYGLERILFNPGVHWLQDPRTKYYNYSQDLQSIPDTSEFDFERLPIFMKPSSDSNLRKLLDSSSQTFAGSTSSLTGALSQIYFTLNGNKPLNTQSQSFVDSPRSFSPGARLPVSIILHRTPQGKYVVDADKAMDTNPDNPLSEKGHILEKMLTYPPEEFDRFLKTSKNPLRPEESRDKKEAYHFATTSGLLMRSQLDCHDDRLPRSSFDIKTRGSVALRHDMLNFVNNAGYQIIQHIGELQSFEREKYDLIRSAFLKYSMQVRIGNMDGIFLAYHSGKRIFGFEYMSLEDLDRAISGSHEESEQAFKLCLGALETILRRVTEDLPGKSLRVSLEALRGALQVFAQPLEGDGSSIAIRPNISAISSTSETEASASENSQSSKDPLLPEDRHTPLLLYDVTFTNYLNGFEVRKGENVDFGTFKDPSSSSVVAELSKTDEAQGNEGASEIAAIDEDAIEASETDDSPSIVKQPITWSTSMDIAVSTDLTLNTIRLTKLRKRQAKFANDIMLPEGLTPHEITRALKGFTEEEALAALAEAEKGKWAGGSFKARAGVSYTTRLYGIAKTVRSIAKEGRKTLAKQDKQQKKQKSG